MSLQGYWADQPFPRLRSLPGDLVVVLPLGAIEQHGPHLPLSVDRDLTEAVLARALPLLTRKQNVLILPTLCVTKSDEHDLHPGTLSLSAETLLAVLRDQAASLARAGVRRLVLFNGHGGNTAALELAARDMRMAHDMIAASCSWFGFADTAAVLPDVDLSEDIHAGLLETSAMLAARPELVDMSKAKDFRTSLGDWAKISPRIGLAGQPVRPGWVIEDLSLEGACGNAADATAEIGEALLHAAAEGFASFLAEFASFDHRGAGR